MSKSPSQKLLDFFSYKHLPLKLQKISKPCCKLAEEMERQLENSAEKTVGLIT